MFNDSEFAVIWEVYATLMVRLATTELKSLPFVEVEQRVRRTLNASLTSAAPKWSGARRDKALMYLLDEVFGLGPLESLLASKRVSEVRVSNATTIMARIDGRFQATSLRFRDSAHLVRIKKRALKMNGVAGIDIWATGTGFSMRKTGK